MKKHASDSLRLNRALDLEQAVRTREVYRRIAVRKV